MDSRSHTARDSALPPLPAGLAATGATAIELELPAEGVAVVRLCGHATVELLLPVLVELERFADTSPPGQAFFYDAWHLASLDSTVRARLTFWHDAHRAALDAVHVLMRPGEEPIHMPVPGAFAHAVTVYTSPRAFRAALDRRTRTASRPLSRSISRERPAPGHQRLAG